jgi:HNH endonuclease
MVRQKHIDWFRRGAGALRALARENGREDALPTPEDWYLCPLCLDGLTIEELSTGGLTVEHVPPRALGGRELVLTCEQCNSQAGGKFDGPAHTQDRLRRLLSGQGDRPETVMFAVDSFAARVEMRTAGQAGMIFTAVPQINNPADLNRAETHMRELSATRSTDFRIEITPQARYSPDHARVSWVRTGYLAAFALFGWRYILQPALQPVRDQLQDPSSVTLPPLSMYIPDGDPDRREIWIVKKPAERQSLFVLSGRHGVSLPLPGDSRTLAQLADSIGADTAGPVRHSFTGDMIPWPCGPEHLLDPPPVPGGRDAGHPRAHHP